MPMGIPEPDIREALSTIGQYLSDTIPPVQAAESVAALLEQSPQLMAAEIIGWIPAQYQGSSESPTIADYIFHAVSKLHYLAQLQLISEKSLAPYLDSVKQLVLEHCPPDDRALLQESFEHLGMADATMATPVSFIHRQRKSGEPDAEARGESRNRRLSILGDRLKMEAQKIASSSANGEQEELVSHLIATAASNVQTSDEFRKLQENLRSMGMDPGTDKIFRKLSHSLPGWMIASTGANSPKSHNVAIEAMSQIIHLSEDRWESGKRFQEMVQAGIEQFNTGSLARSATMFDLALGLCSDGKLDPATVAGIRETAHESLDWNRLRNVAKERDKDHLLRKVLSFFDAFAVKNLLDRLQKEEKRDRRRLLLDLLEVHGDAARKMAFERLRDLLVDTNVAADWHFARNLVCILNRIPRPAEASPKAEMELVASLLRLSLPAPLVKEAISFAGHTKCAESEDLLISIADKLVRFAVENTASGKDSAQRVSLLDRAIFALAHYGTAKAYARVVKHGTTRLEGLGDTVPRLSYLSSQDLTSDKESLTLLIQFLKSKMPRKLLGVTIQKNEQPLLHVIKALSSTPAPIVRQTFQEIAAQFPDSKFGDAATAALKEFGSMDKVGIPAERILTGDLDLFGLPDLLRQLNQLQATGTLTLKDAKGNPAGSFSLIAGRMESCSAGRLEGKEAAYQLLERPMAGTFVFHGQRNPRTPEHSADETMPDLNSILSEGMRRYDELQRARAIVPDFSLLRRQGPEPVRPGEEEDAMLFDIIWPKIEAGASPEECEAICRTDSYRVRTLLARWSESGALTVG